MERIREQSLYWAASVVRRLCTAASEVTSSVPSSSVAVANATKGIPLYNRLAALDGAPEGSVKWTMNKWLREGKFVRAKEVVGYARQFRKRGRFRHALELMEWMDMRGMNMSYNNYALRIHLLSKADGVDSAEEYFNNLPEPAKKHQTYGSLLNVYCTERLAEKAISLFEEMKRLNYINTLAYNNLMGLYAKIGQQDKVPFLLQEMKVKNIRRDRYSYNILISCYSALGNIEAVERVVQDMEVEDADCLKWTIYSNVASIYIRAGLVEKAESSLRRFEEVMDQMDRPAYHHLISLHAKMENLAEVLRVWNSLKTKVKTTNMSFLIIFHALNKLNDFSSLDRCFHDWESSYETYNIRLVNVMIAGYLKRDMIREAESLCDSAAAKGAEPDERTFELLTDYYLRNNDFESALKCFETAALKLKVWKLDKSMVDAFLSHFEERKDAGGAEAFCQKLKKLDSLDSEAHDSQLEADLVLGENEPSLSIEEDDDRMSSETAKLLDKAFNPS